MNKIAVGIGEVLWDVFPDESHFGGAPANFAAHCASLQARSYVVSRIGDDELGREARQRLAGNQVDDTFLQLDPSHATGTVDVQLSDDGKATYQFAMDTAWDHLQWEARLVDLAQQCDVVCYGTLGQRHPIARQTIRQFVEATPPSCLRVLDVNLRQEFFDSEIIRHSLKMATALKLNEEELPKVLELCGMPVPQEPYQPGAETVRDLVQDLISRFELQWVTLTAGQVGAEFFRDQEVVFQESPETEVADTVGAGDSFTATLVCDLMQGIDPQVALRHAARVAAFVCTQPGATPPLPEALRTPEL